MLSRTRILLIMTEWLPEVAKAIKEQIMENLTALARGECHVSLKVYNKFLMFS